MKIIFVLPGVGKKEDHPYITSWKMEPLSFAVLASLTPPDIEVKLVDDRLETINYDEPADLVAISVETYTAKRSYDIASSFRERGIPVILGGYHPTLLPGEAIRFADSIVLGEAENVWPQVLNDIKNNCLKRLYKSDQRPTLSGLSPDRSIFNGKKYMPITLVETARGCKFACNFCSISAFYQRSHNYRPPKEVAAEIERTGKKNFFLVDDNIVANSEVAKELFKELIPLKIRWVSQGSLNMANDRELLKLMAKSGCMGLLIGFESLNQQNLMQMNKSWNNSKYSYDESLNIIREHGLAIYATFVFGYDSDDKNTFDKTVEFAIKHKFFLAAFNHLVPFPGTVLYNKLKQEGRLRFDKWWLHPDYRYGDIAFWPKRMSPEQLKEYCLQARKNFFRYGSITSRLFDFKTNCQNAFYALIFLSTNLMLRKEIGLKMDIPIGLGLDS